MQILLFSLMGVAYKLDVESSALKEEGKAKMDPRGVGKVSIYSIRHLAQLDRIREGKGSKKKRVSLIPHGFGFPLFLAPRYSFLPIWIEYGIQLFSSEFYQVGRTVRTTHRFHCLVRVRDWILHYDRPIDRGERRARAGKVFSFFTSLVLSSVLAEEEEEGERGRTAADHCPFSNRSPSAKKNQQNLFLRLLVRWEGRGGKRRGV